MRRPAATASKEEKALYADIMSGMYLGNANEADERGDHVKAEALYLKSQYWLDRYNKLSGNC